MMKLKLFDKNNVPKKYTIVVVGRAAFTNTIGM